MPNLLRGVYDERLMEFDDAMSVLETYTDEHNISLSRLPASAIADFVDTIAHVPSDISTEDIAQLCGIRTSNERTSNRRPQYSYATLGNSIREVPTLEAVSLSDYFSTPSPFQAKKPRRSEYDMMAQIVRQEGFPRPNFKDWSSERELQDIVNDWHRNVEYKEQWIFSRREREGFNRRNINVFNLDDVMARMTKRKKAHQLDTEKSKFYDWKLGGTDWVLQLELYQHEQHYFLVSRFIHKPSNSEIKFDVRYWNGQQFTYINGVFCEYRNNNEIFERRFGSLNESSPYYVAPFEVEDEDYDSDYDELVAEMDAWEDSDD